MSGNLLQATPQSTIKNNIQIGNNLFLCGAACASGPKGTFRLSRFMCGTWELKGQRQEEHDGIERNGFKSVHKSFPCFH
ncbi:hypothetical protein L596_030856 [Steinernema carpocapsae]|uniref:Uncharacterized protein n=1 Tax=Steinernema carpocapsae TaxID=34508 RepID=A0A4U5LNF2_STECR|nr:hypothetical protein L596_030856 [Steinernema carpocapsae]